MLSFQLLVYEIDGIM